MMNLYTVVALRVFFLHWFCTNAVLYVSLHRPKFDTTLLLVIGSPVKLGSVLPLACQLDCLSGAQSERVRSCSNNDID